MSAQQDEGTKSNPIVVLDDSPPAQDLTRDHSGPPAGPELPR